MIAQRAHKNKNKNGSEKDAKSKTAERTAEVKRAEVKRRMRVLEAYDRWRMR